MSPDRVVRVQTAGPARDPCERHKEFVPMFSR